MAQRVIPPISDLDALLKRQGFRVLKIDNQSGDLPTYKRKHFYKATLITGKSHIHYADKAYHIDSTTLFFGTPYIPYAWDFVSKKQEGFTCVFAEDFLKGQHSRSQSLQASPLFKIGGTPVFNITKEQKTFLSTIFQKMFDEQDSAYAFTNELIRNYINVVIHEALKMQPSQNFTGKPGAASRVASLFFELLERQFPIENTAAPLKLKTPGAFAKRLSVHVNHLNHSVKEITGKPTTYHITARIIAEAKALLLHTNWNIAEIAYALGFEYPGYFNNYFKKMTGTNPASLRRQNI